MLDLTSMNDALRGLNNLTTRFPAIGKTMAALTGLLVLSSTTAYGQVLLDDFSASNESRYEFVPVFGGPSDGWTVTSGELRPIIDSSGSATWLWNQGEKLSALGDSVSISLSLPAGVTGSFPTSIGLFLAADSASVGFGHEISQTTFNGIWSYSVDGSAQQAASPPSGPVQLTVRRTAQTGGDFVYTVSFSGGGLPSPLTDTFTDASASLLFGPFAYNTAGAGTPAALDNFSFTAVPEPSMYAAVFGFLALTTVVLRTRSSRRFAA
jgi:hypothetical protein